MKMTFHVFIAASILIAISACAPSNKPYVDSKGRFSVTPPKGWKMETFQGERSQVAFKKSNDIGLMIIAQDWDQTDQVPETEKIRIKTSYPQMMKAKHNTDVTDVHDGMQMIAGAEGWVYSCHVPSRALDVRVAVLIKSGTWHSMTLISDGNTEEIWSGILASYRAPAPADSAAE